MGRQLPTELYAPNGAGPACGAWSAGCSIPGMATDVRNAEVHGVLERYHVRYEVRPYYVVWDQRPEGREPVEQKVNAGFDVDLYGELEKYQFPLFHTDDARTVLNYFASLAHEIQASVGQGCTIEITPCPSLVLDTQKHFQSEAMLQIRISHERGLDQPAGPPEQQALKAIREALHELGARET
jgi:hypothetical protein